MPTVQVRCECGERFRTSEDDSGIRCPGCGRRLRLKRFRQPESAANQAGRPPTGKSNFGATIARWGASIRRTRWTDIARSLKHPVVFLCWAYLFASILLAACIWIFGDVWWLGTVLLFIGRWIFLLPLVVLVPAALFTRPKLLIPTAIAALIMVGPVMGARIGVEAWMPVPEGQRIRVVSFNTDERPQPAVNLQFLLDEWKPDIVAFQECGGVLHEAIRELSGWNFHRARGLCLITRFAILDSVVVDRTTLEQIKQDGWGIGGSGDVVQYDLGTPAGPIHFTNLHLETPRKGFESFFTGASGAFIRLRQNTELRDSESRLARRHVDAGGAPKIVAGDFNTPVESRIFRRHWGSLKDAHSSAGFGLGMTKLNGWIRIRIDHVLTDDSWRIIRVTTGAPAGSSHLPVIVDLIHKSP